MQVGDGVTLDRHAGRLVGPSAGRSRVHTGGVVSKVGIKARFFDISAGQAAGKLLHHCTHDFKVAQFLRTDIR